MKLLEGDRIRSKIKEEERMFWAWLVFFLFFDKSIKGARERVSSQLSVSEGMKIIFSF